MSIIRFGVSIEEDLVKRFDQLLKQQKYPNRSEAIRDLIRQALVEEEWSEARIIAGGIVLVYDHHKRQLVGKLMDLQHKYHHIIISTQHIHLNHNDCLEFLVIKGKPVNIKDLYNALKTVKGVKHVGIVRTTTGESLP